MNEQTDFERLVADQLGHAAVGAPPESAITETIERAGGSRRLPEWLALIKESPMRTNSHLAVGSPTVRVLAILGATLLLALTLAAAGAGAQRLMAAGGPIVVDQSGEGDYDTIGEAVAAAADGDEVIVRPGTYAESVMIDKDLAVRGEGAAVLQAPEEGPTAITHGETADGERYAMLLSDVSGSVEGLTFRGDHSLLIVSGGSPTVLDNVFDEVGFAFGTAGLSFDGSSIVLNRGTSAAVRGNTILDGGPIATFGGASPTIEENVLEGGPHLFLTSDSDLIVRDNRITGTLVQGIGMYSSGNVLIEGNHFSDLTGIGINLDPDPVVPGVDLIVRDNTVAGASRGIEIAQGAAAMVEGNTLTDNEAAVRSQGSSGRIAGNLLFDNRIGLSLIDYPGEITDNVIEGGGAGILIQGGSSLIDGNDVTGHSGRAISIGGDSTATLTDNRSCDNGENLWIADTAEPDIDDSNEICEDATTE